MRQAKHFQRRAGGVFRCSICTRPTRITSQCLDSRLCADCYELAGYENEVLDGHRTVEQIAQFRDHMVMAIVSKGGSREMIREAFGVLWGDK